MFEWQRNSLFLHSFSNAVPRFGKAATLILCSHLGLGPGARATRIPPGRDIGRERDLLRDSTGFPQDEAVPAGDGPVAPTGDG